MGNHSTIKGKVVLVPFPFDDLSTAKVRPAVCLTDPIGPYRHIILAFITSRIPPDLVDSDLVIDMNHEDFSRTGLRLTSTVRLHRVMTVRIGIIKRKLGTLSDTQRTEVGGRLRRMFGF